MTTPIVRKPIQSNENISDEVVTDYKSKKNKKEIQNINKDAPNVRETYLAAKNQFKYLNCLKEAENSRTLAGLKGVGYILGGSIGTVVVFAVQAVFAVLTASGRGSSTTNFDYLGMPGKVEKGYYLLCGTCQSKSSRDEAIKKTQDSLREIRDKVSVYNSKAEAIKIINKDTEIEKYKYDDKKLNELPYIVAVNKIIELQKKFENTNDEHIPPQTESK